MSVSHVRPVRALLRWSVSLLVSTMSSLCALTACLVARHGVLIFSTHSTDVRWALGLCAVGVVVMCWGIWWYCDYTRDLVSGVVSPDDWVADHLLEHGSRQWLPGVGLIPLLVVGAGLWYAIEGRTAEEFAFICLLVTSCVGSAHIGIFVWPRRSLEAWAADALGNRRTTVL